MVLIILLCILLVFLSMIFPKSKLVTIMDMVAQTIILGGYNGNGDINNYKVRYVTEFIMPGSFEKLYDYIAILLHRCGVSFEVFHIIITAAFFVAVVSVVKRITNKTALVMGLMFGYSSIELALQLQWVAASTVIIVAVYYFFKHIYLIKTPPLKAYLFYGLLIFLGMEFHFGALFFLLLLLMKIIPHELYKKTCVVGTVVLYLLVNLLLVRLGKYVPALSDYIGNYRTIKVFILMTIWELVGLFLIFRYSSIVIKQNIENDTFVRFMQDASWLMLLCIPFYSITTIMDRMFHIWFIFYFCVVSLHYKCFKAYVSEIIFYIYNWGSFITFYIVFVSNGLYLVTEIINNNVLWGTL